MPDENSQARRIAELEEERGALIAAACWWRDYTMNGREPASPYPDFARFSSIPFPPAFENNQGKADGNGG
jgi:hypothetical protein